MVNKETLIMDGETYYLIKGKWYDSHFTSVSKEELYKLNALRMKNIDFSEKTAKELIDLAQSMKDNDDFVFSKKLFEELLSKSYESNIIRSILPRYTSILRKLEKPQEAIKISEEYYNKFGKSISSSALHTSLAGAYCDIGDYFEARKQANIVNAMSSGDASIELQSVYARIKKMEK